MTDATIKSPALPAITPGAHVHFIGIGGTGMAAVAGLCQESGLRVTGSDAGVYPPMSDMLKELRIPVQTPYAAANLGDSPPDLAVIANVLSRGNVELEAAITRQIPYTSFPALLGGLILSKKTACVVAGTHGKTTTSSLLAHVLDSLGEAPGFMIGGIPRNFARSFRLGAGPLFVIEGDEYDTAFFDKGPKFLHYRPQFLILNNLEFDHADIYPNVEAIEDQFVKLAGLVPDPANIIANVDDAGITRVLARTGLNDRVTRVATLGGTGSAAVAVTGHSVRAEGPGTQVWTVQMDTARFGRISLQTALAGKHNLANIAQVLACLFRLEAGGLLRRPLTLERIQSAVSSFLNVARRLDLLAEAQGIAVYEDFAHHPTAVQTVIEGFRAAYPKARLLLAFEPRSATNRRNVFQQQYVSALNLADRVYIGECMNDQRIPEDQRFNAQALVKSIGAKARAFSTNLDLYEALTRDITSGDAVIFMSSGSFGGVQHRLAGNLKERSKAPQRVSSETPTTA